MDMILSRMLEFGRAGGMNYSATSRIRRCYEVEDAHSKI